MNEKLSYTEYLVVGSPRTEFDVGFEDYQNDKDMLKLTVDNKDVTEAGYSVERNVGNTLVFTPAVPVDAVVRIQRITDIDAPFYIFTAGNAFVPSNVDANFKQLLHSQQEVRDRQDHLEQRVIPVVDGLEDALEAADAAAKSAQEAKEAAEEAAEATRQADKVIDKSGLTQQAINDGIESRTALRELTPTTLGIKVYLKSIHAGLGLGSGFFVSVAKTSNLVDNGGTILSTPDSSMVWSRLRETPFVTVEDFGAVPYDDTYDDYDAIQNAVATSLETRLRTGRYVVSKPIIVKSQQALVGEGMGKTQIRKFTTTPANIDKTGMTGAMATVDYNVDATVIILPQLSNYTQYPRIEELCLQNGTSYDTGKGYALFAPYMTSGTFKNVLLNFAEFPLYTINSWMCSWETVHSYSKFAGMIFGGRVGDTGRGGTSNHMSNCWVVGNKTGYAYSFYGYMYSAMDSCGADGNGITDGHTEGILYVERSTMTITALGAEDNYCKRIIRNISSRLKVNSLQVLNFHNTSGNSTALFEVVGATARTIVDSASLEFTNFANPTTLNSPKFANASTSSLFRCVYSYVDQGITGINNGTPFEIVKDSTSSVEFFAQGSSLSDYGTAATGLTTSNTRTSNQNYVIRSIQASDKILTTATALYADIGFLNDAACRYNTAKFKLGNSSIFRDALGRPRYKLNGNPADQLDGIPLDGFEVLNAPPTWVARAGHAYVNSTDNTLRIFTAGGWVKIATTPV